MMFKIDMVKIDEAGAGLNPGFASKAFSDELARQIAAQGGPTGTLEEQLADLLARPPRIELGPEMVERLAEIAWNAEGKVCPYGADSWSDVDETAKDMGRAGVGAVIAVLAAMAEMPWPTREQVMRRIAEEPELRGMGPTADAILHDFRSVLSPIIGALRMELEETRRQARHWERRTLQLTADALRLDLEVLRTIPSYTHILDSFQAADRDSPGFQFGASRMYDALHAVVGPMLAGVAKMKSDHERTKAEAEQLRRDSDTYQCEAQRNAVDLAAVRARVSELETEVKRNAAVVSAARKVVEAHQRYEEADEKADAWAEYERAASDRHDAIDAMAAELAKGEGEEEGEGG